MKAETRQDIAFLAGLVIGGIVLLVGIFRDEAGLITSGAGLALSGELWARIRDSEQQ